MDAIKPTTQPNAPPKPVPAEPEPGRAASGKDLPDSGKEPPARVEPISLRGAVEQIETYLSSSQRSLQFRLDESSGRPVMTVTNPATGEVIRQVPGDEVLKMAAAIETGGARLIDTRA